MTTRVQGLKEEIRAAAIPLAGPEGEYGALLEMIGESRFVLIGEATHGTAEFYRSRAEITRRLIEEKGFTLVAVEADWPDAYRVNRYVRGVSRDACAEEALEGFQRFPQWMWRNTEVRDFVEWLRRYNQSLAAEDQAVGFYGLDLYSLFGSQEAVIRYLEEVDPEAAERARARYACFEHAAEDPQAYGHLAGLGITPACEEEALRQLLELRERAEELIGEGGAVEVDEHFYAEQNARLVLNAEEYYRTMFQGRVSSWNLRDRHMADTLNALVEHFGSSGAAPKVVVWEHNSHLGDARATYMSRIGEWNVGQLVRERHGEEVRLIGYTTYEGWVTAASDWGAPAERKRVRPALPASVEALFHESEMPNFLLILREGGGVAEALGEERLERAIGVIYLPRTERQSHYFEARVAEQFDAVIHFDWTTALEPLERSARWESGEPPETYPFGL